MLLFRLPNFICTGHVEIKHADEKKAHFCYLFLQGRDHQLHIYTHTQTHLSALNLIFLNVRTSIRKQKVREAENVADGVVHLVARLYSAEGVDFSSFFVWEGACV